MTIELEKLLPPDLYERLQEEAQRHSSPVGEVVRDAVAAYFEQQDNELEDTSDEEILAGFREGWRDIMNGDTVPAEEAMARLRAKHAHHAQDDR